MKFYSYFLIFFLSFTRCFGLTSQEVMQQTVTIDLYCAYIEKQYYAEGKIASPYCVLACVVTETITHQASIQAPSEDTASPTPPLQTPQTTQNLDLKNTVYSFLSDSSAEKDDGVHIQNGMLKAVFGNFSIGIDLVGFAQFVVKKLQQFITNTRVEKEFVSQYNGWTHRDFQHDALNIIRQGNQNRDDTTPLSQIEQEAILSEYHLYQFEGFRSYIKTFSCFEPFIDQLAIRVHFDNKERRQRWWKKFPGFFYETFPDVVQSLYKQAADERAERKKREQEERARENEAKQLMYASMQERLHYYAEYMSECADDFALAAQDERCDSDLQKERFRMRAEVIKQAKKNNYCLTTKGYNIPTRIDHFLQDHHLDPDVLKQCEGSFVQQWIHYEIIVILDHTAAVNTQYGHLQDPSITLFTNTISNVATASAEYNHAGHVKQALMLTDCCWSLLDCANGIAKGLCDGIYKVYDAAQNPFDTALNMADSAWHLVRNATWHTGRVLYELFDVVVACETDKTAAGKHMSKTVKNIEAVVTNLADKVQKLPLETVAREGTAMVVDALLTKKCLSALYTFYASVQKELVPILQKIEQTGQIPVIAGAPGIIIAEGAAATTQLFKQAAEAVKEAGQAVGGVVGQITKVPSAYVARKVSYMIYKEKELLGLFLNFRNALKIGHQYAPVMGFKNVKITMKTLKHIFGVEITEKMGKSGIVDTIVQGFHHDLGNKMSNLIKNTVVDKITGVVTGTLEYLGQVKKNKTLFPSSWSRSKVMKKIQESLLNPTKLPEFKDNRWIYIGKTVEGIEIKIILETTGELITAYPIL